jgi:hypothetical protein
MFTLVLVYAIGLGSMAMVGMLSPLTARSRAIFRVVRPRSAGPFRCFRCPPPSPPSWGRAGRSAGAAPRADPGALLLAVADLGLVQARALWLFDLSMVLAGIAYVGVLNGGAAMLMTTLGGSLRARGMALWATYAPAGFSAGLLLAALVAQWANWRWLLPPTAR